MTLPAAGHLIEFAGHRFPADGLTLSSNFADAVAKTSRVVGVSGGFDEYRDRQAPIEVGNVSISFVLVAQDRDDMQALRDAVYKLQSKGKQELRWKPDGFTEFRFCNARINNIRISQRPSEHTDLHQSVSINFQVSDPCWYSYPFEVWYLDGSVDLDGETNLAGWDADSTTLAMSSGTAQAFPVNGSADTFPVLILEADGETYSNIRIQRLNESMIVQDEIKILEPLEDTLTIDCRKYSAIWSTIDPGFDERRVDWIDKINTMRAQFFRLSPGLNYIRVYTDLDEPISLTVQYLEGWR